MGSNMIDIASILENIKKSLSINQNLQAENTGGYQFGANRSVGPDLSAQSTGGWEEPDVTPEELGYDLPDSDQIKNALTMTSPETSGILADQATLYQNQMPKPEYGQIEAFKQIAADQPNRDDFQPSIWRKLLGATVGGTTGYLEGGTKGIAAARNITDEPFNTAVSDWSMKLKPAQQLADIETEKNRDTLRYNEQQDYLRQRAAESAHRAMATDELNNMKWQQTKNREDRFQAQNELDHAKAMLNRAKAEGNVNEYEKWQKTYEQRERAMDLRAKHERNYELGAKARALSVSDYLYGVTPYNLGDTASWRQGEANPGAAVDEDNNPVGSRSPYAKSRTLTAAQRNAEEASKLLGNRFTKLQEYIRANKDRFGLARGAWSKLKAGKRLQQVPPEEAPFYAELHSAMQLMGAAHGRNVQSAVAFAEEHFPSMMTDPESFINGLETYKEFFELKRSELRKHFYQAAIDSDDANNIDDVESRAGDYINDAFTDFVGTKQPTKKTVKSTPKPVLAAPPAAPTCKVTGKDILAEVLRMRKEKK